MNEDALVVYQRYTLDALQCQHPGACETDVQLVWKKDDDDWELYAYAPLTDDFFELPRFCGVREMRLFAKQLLVRAEELEAGSLPSPHTKVKRP